MPLLELVSPAPDAARIARLVLLLGLGGCEPETRLGELELELYDRPVVCDGARQVCSPAIAPGGTAPAPQTTPGASAVVPEALHGDGFISARASRHTPHGVYMYFELARPSEASALLELDLPVDGGSSEALVATYHELAGGRVTFRSAAVRGRVEVPTGLDSDPSECGCPEGRLELVFTDAGADGKLGTADDQVRRLSRGRFHQGSGTYCYPRRVLDVSFERPVEVLRSSTCPATSPAPTPTPRPPEPAGGCEVDPDYAVEEDPGCEPDDTSSPDFEDTGCGGDDSGWESSDEGCEADSGGGDAAFDSSGCEGDGSATAADACEGEAYAATRRPARRSRPTPTLPFLLGGLLLVRLWGRRRSRRRPQLPAPAADNPSCSAGSSSSPSSGSTSSPSAG